MINNERDWQRLQKMFGFRILGERVVSNYRTEFDPVYSLSADLHRSSYYRDYHTKIVTVEIQYEHLFSILEKSADHDRVRDRLYQQDNELALIEIAEKLQKIEHSDLLEKHPGLREAYDKYQSLLALVNG